jgi:hypothetical protein
MLGTVAVRMLIESTCTTSLAILWPSSKKASEEPDFVKQQNDRSS